MKRRKRRILVAVGLVLVLLAAYLFLWPVSIDPKAWSPPAAPGWSGAFARNDGLAKAQWLAKDLPVPEAVAVDREGWLWTGTLDGRIVRMRPDGSQAKTVAKTGGRPLGLKFAADGRLIVADAHKGLIAVDRSGKVAVLTDSYKGQKLGFVDDLDIARDGTIYFSDASTKFRFEEYILDVLEHGANGRLYAYDPATKRTELLLSNLYFANGVVVAPDQRSVLVTETSNYRIRRVWLEAGRRGKWEVFAKNLPGFPDNVTWSPTRRVFWVAMGAPRNKLVDKLADSPFWRKVIARLPGFLRPKPERIGHVVAFDEKGKLIASLQDHAPGSYAPISSVIEHGGWLYLGSFARNGIARVRAPANPGSSP